MNAREANTAIMGGGCLLVLLLAAPFVLGAILKSILTSLGLKKDIAMTLGYVTTLLSFVALIWYYITSENQAKKNVQALEKKIEEALGEPLVDWQTGQLVGNNYPPIKSDNRTLILAVGEKYFGMFEHDTVTGVTLPVEKVKANVTTQSAVKGLDIFLFGVFALDKKEKLLVLDFEDPASEEKYTCVFKGITTGFADTINKQRYLRITEAKKSVTVQKAHEHEQE